MLQLVYLSFATDAWDDDLRALCEQSAPRNARLEITGVILLDHGVFLHAIEGPRASVEDIFISIIKDPRHHSLRLLSRRTLANREFGYGAMTVLETDRARLAALARIDAVVALAGDDARSVLSAHVGNGDHVFGSRPTRGSTSDPVDAVRAGERAPAS